MTSKNDLYNDNVFDESQEIHGEIKLTGRNERSMHQSTSPHSSGVQPFDFQNQSQHTAAHQSMLSPIMGLETSSGHHLESFPSGMGNVGFQAQEPSPHHRRQHSFFFDRQDTSSHSESTPMFMGNNFEFQTGASSQLPQPQLLNHGGGADQRVPQYDSKSRPWTLTEGKSDSKNYETFLPLQAPSASSQPNHRKLTKKTHSNFGKHLAGGKSQLAEARFASPGYPDSRIVSRAPHTDPALPIQQSMQTMPYYSNMPPLSAYEPPMQQHHGEREGQTMLPQTSQSLYLGNDPRNWVPPPPPPLHNMAHMPPFSASYAEAERHTHGESARVRKGHSRSRSKTHRRRNSSRVGEVYDSGSIPVTLVAPTFVPGMSTTGITIGPQVAERPPGGIYWAVISQRANDEESNEPGGAQIDEENNEDDDDDEEEEEEEEGEDDGGNGEGNDRQVPAGRRGRTHKHDTPITMPIQLCQPPLYNIMPAYPQALDADPQPRVRKQSKYTAEQDRMILDLKIKGKSWAEIAALAGCHNQLAARNRYQVLIGQQGGGTFFWTTEDCAALQDTLDEGERAKWLFIAEELSKQTEEEFTIEMVHYKVASMFAENSEQFGVLKTTDPSRGGAPFKRTLLHDE